MPNLQRPSRVRPIQTGNHRLPIPIFLVTRHITKHTNISGITRCRPIPKQLLRQHRLLTNVSKLIPVEIEPRPTRPHPIKTLLIRNISTNRNNTNDNPMLRKRLMKTMSLRTHRPITTKIPPWTTEGEPTINDWVVGGYGLWQRRLYGRLLGRFNALCARWGIRQAALDQHE